MYFLKRRVRGTAVACTSVLLTLLMLGLSACSRPANQELEEFLHHIRAKYDMKEAAFASNDPQPILTRFYHAGVISTDPEGVTHVGRDALRPVYAEVIGSSVRIESYRSFVKGDAGWDWVNFHVTPPADTGQEPFTFKMLFLWAREDGEWWSHGEMFVLGEFALDKQAH